jgi:hypothetical protein
MNGLSGTQLLPPPSFSDVQLHIVDALSPLSFRDAPLSASPESIEPPEQLEEWIPGSMLRIAPE